MEKEFPEPSIIPSTPCKRFVSGLLEVWADEYWLPIAMHTRWSHAETEAAFKREAGNLLLPYMPQVFKDMVAGKVVATLRSYLPQLGVRESQYKLLDAWIDDMLAKLDIHFGVLPYLLDRDPRSGTLASSAHSTHTLDATLGQEQI